MKKFLSLLCPTIICGGLAIGAIGSNSFSYEKEKGRAVQKKKKEFAIPLQYLRYAPVRDTVYVLGDSYITISLKEQKARHFFRSGELKEYRISSGNPYIKKGMATPTGIYSVQTKNPLAKSKQFDDAKLHFWVGFNGNIGFHGLDGRGYYWNLGLRPSSHGCVRIAREDGEKLYKDAKKGTPVLVYRDEPARVFAFADEKDVRAYHDLVLEKRNSQQIKILRERLKNLYDGKFYFVNQRKIFLDGKTPLWTNGQLEVGDVSRISPTQERPALIAVQKFTEKKDRFDKIFAFVQSPPDSNLSRAQ